MALKLTDGLRKHAREKFAVAADASDDVIAKTIGDKIQSNELTPEQFVELSKEAAPKAEDLLTKKIREEVGPAVDAAFARFTETFKSFVAGQGAQQTPGEKAVAAATQGAGAAATPPAAKGMQKLLLDNHNLLNQNTADSAIRVKSAAEQYDGTSKRAIYPTHTKNGSPHFFAGQEATHLDDPLDHPSRRALAVAGAWFKMSLAKAEGKIVHPKFAVTDHDRDLVQYAIEHSRWSGYVSYEEIGDGATGDEVVNRKLHAHEQMHLKALLDDSTSGGINIVPVEFDNAIVLFPVLYGELYPFVNLVPVVRGRRMVSGSLTNPTVGWGTPEGTAISALNTASLIAAFNTNIWALTGAIQIGLDFLEDSPTNIGEILVKKYGEKTLEALDNVIANGAGDGSSQPLGIFNTSGAVTINTDAGPGGQADVTDYEALMFGVFKQFRFEPGARPAYVANDTSYQRSRSIPVSVLDQRRVFGMTHQDYTLLSTPYKIQNSILNNQIAFCMLNRYRMYKRLGLTVRQETAGQTLALANERLIVIRARYGGQMETGQAVSIISDAQA